MPTSLVRPGYGPTLPEIVAGWPRPARWAARAAGLLLVLLVIGWVLFGRDDGVARIVVEGPVAFNLGHDERLERQDPKAGELLRLSGDGQEFIVRPLKLPAGREDYSGFLTLYSFQVGEQMKRERPGLVIRGEGRVSINKEVGYELTYQVPGEDARKRYGRRLMMLPDPAEPEGVEIQLEADASAAVVNPDSVGQTGGLKAALRSFRFGTDLP